MPNEIDFPTSYDDVAPRPRVVEVVDVYHDANPTYHSNAKGLFLVTRNVATNNERSIFYPDPPSRKAKELLAALREIGIEPKTLPDGWKGLIGYTLEMTSKEITGEFSDDDDLDAEGRPKRKKYTLTVEIPTSVVEAPKPRAARQARVATPATAPVAAKSGVSTDGASGDYDELKLSLLKMMPDKTKNSLRYAAAKAFQDNKDFLAAITKGVVSQELVDEDLAYVDDDGRYQLTEEGIALVGE